MRGLLVSVSFAVLAGLLFFLAVRPWYLNWGAGRDEVARSLPGDELVSGPRLSSTRSIIVKAPADKIWPWLVQLGYGRAGWYNHDWINVMMGANYFEGRHSSNRILAQFQSLKVGERIPLGPDLGWEVVSLGLDRLLVLTARLDMRTGKTFKAEDPRPGRYLHSSEVYVLEELDKGTTRFIVRDRIGFEMGWTNFLVYALEPGYFIQESAFMRGVKKRAEALAAGARE